MDKILPSPPQPLVIMLAHEKNWESFVTETNSSERQNSKFGLMELWPSAFQCGSRSWELGGESLGSTQDERCGLAYMQGSGPGSEPLTKLEPRASKSYPSVRKRLDSSSLKQ